MEERDSEESDQLPEEQPEEAVHDDTETEGDDPSGGSSRGRPAGEHEDDDEASGQDKD